MAAQNLLDILANKKVITAEVANQVKLESLNTGKEVEEILRQKKLVSEEAILQGKAEIMGIPFISLRTKGISPEALSFIPEPVARRYHLIPLELDKKKNILSVAMSDPLDLQIIEFLERKSGKKIQAFLALPSEIAEMVEEQYGQNLTGEVTQALKETLPSEVKTLDVQKIGEIIREAPIAKIVATLLEYAIRARASDIHIEPEEGRTRVRYRIDGILHEKLVLPKAVHEAVVSRIKILSGMKIDERRIPQDGRFNFKMEEEEVDLRISTLPTVHGEKVVMRLLKKTGGLPSLPDLGLRGLALKNLETAILRPHGIILVTGPTGSGKTTTLYSILTKLNTTRVNILTLEDPVEYQIPGINQVQINPTAGLTFANGLRSFLRQDPNIILVGEVRDIETTDLAIQAALTGHLVFATLHTNNASTAFPRLIDMGAEPFLVSSSLNAILAQRICRRICQSCKESYQPPEAIIRDIKEVLGKLFPTTNNSQPTTHNQQLTTTFRLYRGKGCSECNKTGYYGRIGIFEVLSVSEKIGRLILERTSSFQIEKQAVDEGMVTLKQDGYLKILEGITTIEEVLRVAQD